MVLKCVLLAAFLLTFVSTEQLCGIGKYIPIDCSSGLWNEVLPIPGATWQIDIDTTNGKVLWWNPSDASNKAQQATISDFSDMYHIAMVFGGGTFDLSVDNSFLKTRYNPTHVSFPTSTRVSVGNGATTRIIGEKIALTSVTSYQLTFTSYGTNMCFGLISASDINTVAFDGGDFTTHWGVCTGSTYPVGQLTAVCPCATCATGCATCIGLGISDCTACESGSYGPSCSPCHAYCSACTGSTFMQCSACKPGYFLQSSTTCASTCPSAGYWADSSNHICVPCDPACYDCASSSNTQCSTCNPGYFKQPAPATTTCLNSCPSGYREDPGTKTCVGCHPYCSGCTGNLNSQCTACKLGYFLQPAPFSTTCTNSCPSDGYWQDTTNNICAPCDTSCKTCSGGANTQCSACNAGYFLQPAPSATTCLDSCPAGYWKVTASSSCAACHPGCAICTSSGNLVCSACNSGYFLQPAPSTACLFNSCPIGYWKDTTNNVCATCDPVCSYCTGPSNTQCTVCKSGYFLQPSGTACFNSCPDGYWKNSASSANVCLPCNAACAMCVDSSNIQCSACKPGYFLQPGSTTCLNSCPDRHWKDTMNHLCAPCDASCEICLDGTNSQCSVCNPGYFLQVDSTTCLSYCLNGSFPNSTSNLCLNCDVSCATCTGSANTQCSVCKSGYFLQPSSTICLETCPPIYYYPNTTLHACESCPINCPNCTGPTCDKLDSETLTTIETVATAVSAMAQASIIAAIIIPVIVVTAGSVVALFLDFLGEIALFQYINVPFPVNFEAFMQFFSANIFPNFLAKTYDESESIISTNGKFGEYECSRVFLDNCGGGLDKEFLAIAVIIVTSILAVALKNCPKVHSSICKIRDSYRWNGLLAFYIGDFQEFFVFTLLQFKESATPVFSLVFGILLVVSYFAMYSYFSIALNRRKKTIKKSKDSGRLSRTRSSRVKTSKQEEEIIGDIPESMNMVVEEFVRKNWYSRNFLLLMCLQNAIIGFILVFLQNWGTIQAGIYSYIAIFYGILVLGAFRPFKEKSQAVAFTISQIVKASMGCLALVLGFDEKWRLFSDDQKNAVGIALITLACIGIASSLILSVGLIVKAMIDYCRNLRKRKQEKKTSTKSRTDFTTFNESKINQSNYVETQSHSTNNVTILGSEASMNRLNHRNRSSENLIPRIRPTRFLNRHLHQQRQAQEPKSDNSEQAESNFQIKTTPFKHANRKRNVTHRIFKNDGPVNN